MTALKADNLACSIGRRVIVSGIDLDVQPGTMTALIGVNGAGKSTLMRVLAGIRPATTGRVKIAGKDISRLRPKERARLLAFVAQEEAAPEDLSLSEMVALGRLPHLMPWQVGGSKEKRVVAECLEMVGLTHLADRRCGHLSGGERRRAMLAKGLAQGTDLLLLDEPTNHLDLTTREALSMALNEFEGTVMLVSHDRALLREVCDEFWLVAKGEVSTFDGDLDDYQKYLTEVARDMALAARAVRDGAKAEAAAALSAASASSSATGTEPTVFNSKGKEDRKAQAQARARLNDQLRPLKAELKKVDERMAKAGEERDKLMQSLSSISIGPSERADQGKRLKALEDEIEQLEGRWLELSESIEQISG